MCWMPRIRCQRSRIYLSCCMVLFAYTILAGGAGGEEWRRSTVTAIRFYTTVPSRQWEKGWILWLQTAPNTRKSCCAPIAYTDGAVCQKKFSRKSARAHRCERSQSGCWYWYSREKRTRMYHVSGKVHGIVIRPYFSETL